MAKSVKSIFSTAMVLVCAVGFIASRSYTQEQQPENFQRTFPLNPGGTLRVENYKGTIHVTGSSSNEVLVSVVKRFEGGSDSERKWWMENVKINFSNSSGLVEVKVDYPSQSWNCWRCWEEHENYHTAVDLEIQVPVTTNLNLDGYKPDIRISSLNGDIRIKSYKAPMTIESTTGSIDISTYKDSIRLRNVSARGTLNVHSYKADIDIDARSLEGTAALETNKGAIVLRLPANTGLEVDFQGGRRSSFRSDFPFAIQASSRYQRDARGTINGGGAHLVLRTERGSVTLEKRSGEL
jgi:hypothetical protein